MGNKQGSYKVDHAQKQAEKDMDEGGLHSACTKGDLSKVEELYKDPQDLLELDSDGRNPIMCAVRSGHLNIVKFLLDKAGGVNSKDSDSKTTLHYACEVGMANIVHWLLEAGAEVNAKDSNENTPIHLASELKDHEKQVEIINHLLEHGADPKALNYDDDSAIGLAFQHGSVPLVKLFKARGFNIDLYRSEKSRVSLSSSTMQVDDHYPVYSAIKGGHQDLVLYLIENDVDFKNSQKLGFDCFSLACTSNNIDFIKFIRTTVYDDDLPDGTKRSAIHTAAMECEVPVLKLLLEMGCSLRDLNGYLETPLLSAIVYSQMENITFLLEAGADPSAARYDGKTALHLYCQYIRESGPVLEKILAGSKDINVTDKAQRTPLHYAAMVGSTDVIKFLVRNGADRKAVDRNKATPLHHLCGSRGIHYENETFDCLIKDFDIEALDEQRKTPLHYAADNAPLGYFEALVTHKANKEAVSDDKGSVLHHALASYHWSQAQLLLEKGVYNDEPNKLGKTPFLYSIRCMQLAKMLLDKGANIHAVDEDGQTALHLACQEAKTLHDFLGEDWSPAEEVVELLLKRGSYVNSFDKLGRTPLHLAYDSGKEEVIKVLLSHEADKKAVDNAGKNILHYAAQCFNSDIVKSIFDASLNVADKNGHRPMFYACDGETLKYLIEQTDNIEPNEFRDFFPFGFYFIVDCLEIVFEKGATVGTTDQSGNTMLHKYAEYGLIDEVKYLVEKGADVNARNKDLATPLHVAATHLSFECVQFLVDHGADLSAEDKDHKNPLDCARESKMRFDKMVSYLAEKYGEL